MKTLRRLYNLPDSILLQFSELLVEALPTDIGYFKEFDSKFMASHADDIQADIDIIYNIKTDAIIRDELSEYTDDVVKALDNCNRCFKSIIYFVAKAFPDNIAVHNQFGKNDIDKVRNNQADMVMFMENLEKTTSKYRNQIIDSGCSPNLIDKIPVYKNDLLEKNRKQEIFKKERGIITQDRLLACNKLYKKVKQVSDIAKIIFSDDPARLSKYSLPTMKSSTDSPQDIA